ncbi:Gfo/Idh/MocA family oxidoreductase [Streptomyces sp. NPDC050738]|uniref:Gfo/Idh/MocA family protein n=1 Tax=Streptomyces sp. NPDC050738 TaxID=3154744 RepID=UPI00343F1CEC
MSTSPVSPTAPTAQPPLPVVLAGARGHGRWHLENIRRLQSLGLVTLAGVCELNPLSEEELDGFGSPQQAADFGALLDSTGAAIAVVCTPIPTHTDLALAAAERGVHVLLEKPPAPSYAEFRRMADGVRAAGVHCQIGFQSLGSKALDAIRELIAAGTIGEVLGIGGAGAWVRDEAYFRRAPWAGRRRIGDTDVVDGVLTNPLAHAVATALALDGSSRAEDIDSIEAELFRANDIEADDTSCVRITTRRGTPVVISVTLCADQPDDPYLLIHGTSGRITFWYKDDRILVQRAGQGPEESVHGRTDLLENLLAHLAGSAELLVPPDATGAFMRVVETVRTAPEPTPIPASAWSETEDTDGVRRRTVQGIDGLVAAGADTLTLFSELGVPWALPSEVHSS